MNNTQQDTGKFRTELKDQFYTKPAVAQWFVKEIQKALPWSVQDDTLWIEPSAGSGSFLQAARGKARTIGLDIDPKSEGILRQDFITWSPPPDVRGSLLFFGNPPFGRQGSLAKAFLKRATGFRQTRAIAFVLPRSFQKPSMYQCIPSEFHLVWSEPVPKGAFLVNGSSYDVPCITQIWERRAGEAPRPEPVKEEPVGFTYVPDSGKWQLGVRRVGGRAGTSYTREEGPLSKQSHYFLEFDEAILDDIDEIQKRMNDHEFPTNTTGPRSLSKNEVTCVLNAILESIYAL
jgi:hypothetical protein